MAGNGYYSSQPYRDDPETYDSGYGHNYRNYRLPNESKGIKGKIEQKYWRSKQKVIEKLGKDQDEYVIAGDAEVDARLEAFRHIKMTCIQLMTAIDCYQNKIFALSQDENDMGRFLKDQGSTDKTKAGKMMIAVGKAQAYAAQQRLLMRSSLARLHSEIETFRFRAVQDTQLTVDKMEQARSDYRARLLWMADLSKELDPDQYKRLDKFREVQEQVKAAKKLFDKLKGDVIQKVDLLSASRCNLLSATLEPYQSAMLKFLSTTAKSYNEVSNQHQGHPSYQFNILKHIIPNNGIVDDDEDEVLNEKLKRRERKQKAKKLKEVEPAEETKEDEHTVTGDSGVVEDKLISFDTSPTDNDLSQDQQQQQQQQQKPITTMDLLGGLNSSEEISPGFGEYTAGNNQTDLKDGGGFEDLLGKFEENNFPPGEQPPNSSEPSLLGGSFDMPPQQMPDEGASILSNMAASGEFSEPKATVDDLLFGAQVDNTPKSDMDILSDVLSNQSLGITATEMNESFSGQWQSMFGNQESSEIPTPVDTDVETQGQMFMPSFLLDQMRQVDPQSVAQGGTPKNSTSVTDSAKMSNTPPNIRKNKKEKGKDMSAWFDLFADLDPLANPDEIDEKAQGGEGKQAC